MKTNLLLYMTAGLFILSFFLPILHSTLIDIDTGNTLLGYQVAYDMFIEQPQDDWGIIDYLYYIFMNAANVIAVILFAHFFLKKSPTTFVKVASIIALVSAGHYLILMLFFSFISFSFGYYCWVTAIFLLVVLAYQTEKK